jgi:hypothetical protein
VGPRAGLDAEVRGKILCLCGGSTDTTLTELPRLRVEVNTLTKQLSNCGKGKITLRLFVTCCVGPLFNQQKAEHEKKYIKSKGKVTLQVNTQCWTSGRSE